MAFKYPGLFNIFLVQGKRPDNSNTGLEIRCYRGRKSDRAANCIPLAPFGQLRFALLEQYEAQSEEALRQQMERHHNLWVKVYDVTVMSETA